MTWLGLVRADGMIMNGRVLISLRGDVLLPPDMFEHHFHQRPYFFRTQCANPFRHHEMGDSFVDVSVGTIWLRHPPPAVNCSPSCAISSDSRATLFCVALSDGPTHFVGIPRLNFQTLAGFRASSSRKISPSFRVPVPRTKSLCQLHRSLYE